MARKCIAIRNVTIVECLEGSFVFGYLVRLPAPPRIKFTKLRLSAHNLPIEKRDMITWDAAKEHVSSVIIVVSGEFHYLVTFC